MSPDVQTLPTWCTAGVHRRINGVDPLSLLNRTESSSVLLKALPPRDRLANQCPSFRGWTCSVPGGLWEADYSAGSRRRSQNWDTDWSARTDESSEVPSDHQTGSLIRDETVSWSWWRWSCIFNPSVTIVVHVLVEGVRVLDAQTEPSLISNRPHLVLKAN